MPKRLPVLFAFAALATAPAPPALDDVLLRLRSYLEMYQARLSTTVALETYEQRLGSGPVPRKRLMQSDFLFLRVPDQRGWLGFRYIFLVDNTPIRDRNPEFLQRLAGEPADAIALALANANARYNLGDVPRTINVPTEALGMLDARNASRFRFRKIGEETRDGRRCWKIEALETARPTIIRTPDGSDQVARVTAWVDPADGSVMKTVLDVNENRQDVIRTKITVVYGQIPRLGFLAPIEMVEHYYGRDDSGYTEINAVATYRDYRRFETGGRIVPDR